ncbi:hypothetical protein P154DRAFT_504419 [Amniculicola lignicola CBS 123094]|uniref:AB hydrolase-1 domain-containing protein n=1 Tax=Amniculicola lignicola CBS 123094 TaxID=1392246 RepID=A0A6A5VSK3_9PLEO|nr:hypothetical protein P154DRAFT_504419 [Amniculicola lignicola CBS 123094]
MTGFKNPSIQSSAGGKALCISGTIEVTASANNIHINTAGPVNQSAVTNILIELAQVNSTLDKHYLGETPTLNPITGTYGIYSQICFPNGRINATTLHFLIHGAGCDRSYWDIAPGYSYVDYAAEQGYTTFLFDRLGTGRSDKPDPVQAVQIPLGVAIGHELIQLLRSGRLAGHAFEHVVGIGHSAGSFTTNGITTLHPADLDAAVLTGFSPDTSGAPIAFVGLDLTIASQAVPFRFSGLANGYLTSGSISASQYLFMRSPGYDPAILNLAEATKQVFTLGELFSIKAQVSVNFTGPIDVVNGEFDLPNCHGNCKVPYNKAAAAKDVFYPNASNGSSWYLSAVAGHGLNFHYSAPAAYEHILDFVKANGF